MGKKNFIKQNCPGKSLYLSSPCFVEIGSTVNFYKMPASEIDDIFSGVASTSSLPTTQSTEKKKKKMMKNNKNSGDKKRKAEGDNNMVSKPLSKKKSSDSTVGKIATQDKVAETILDPSKSIENKIAKKLKRPSRKSFNEEDEQFRDSRGKNSE